MCVPFFLSLFFLARWPRKFYELFVAFAAFSNSSTCFLLLLLFQFVCPFLITIYVLLPAFRICQGRWVAPVSCHKERSKMNRG